MVVGSGLIARAFIGAGGDSLADTCFYAAGVSNSGCRDEREFLRERGLLERAMAEVAGGERFVYFSTCSIEDPSLGGSAYVGHKIEMEKLVRERPRHLILRLPQVAGRTPNPHTLLNYLHARMARSERFQIWGGASRNIIDVEDVAAIAMDLIVREDAASETINVANDRSWPMREIVARMERVLGVRAIYDVLDKGTAVAVDIERISAAVARCAVGFGESYLDRVIDKYYGNARAA
ncbi:MAG: NAD-dependent epimerase/dehydratase family protein [Usitatibacter sp.]